MEEIIIVEVRDSGGQLKAWYKLTDFPVGIGRSYSNRIVLDDPFVCPEHLVVEKDAQNCLIVRNLSQVNGTVCHEKKRKIDQGKLSSGLQLNIGRSRLVFRNASDAMQPALRRSSIFSGGALEGANIWHMLVTFAIGFAIAFIHSTLFSYYEDSPRALLNIGFKLLIIGPLLFLPWVLAWSFASIIFVRRSHFCAHVVAAVIGLTLSFFLKTFTSYSAFAFDSARISGILGVGLQVALLFLVLLLHLSCATKNTLRLNMVIGSTISILTFAVIYTYVKIQLEQFSDNLQLSESLKPPAFRVVSGKPLDAFVADLSSLKVELQEELEARN